MKYDIEKLCRVSGFNADTEDLTKLSEALDRNIQIVSAIDHIKIREDLSTGVHEDRSQEDIPLKFDNVEKLRAQFPNRRGNELEVKKSSLSRVLIDYFIHQLTPQE